MRLEWGAILLLAGCGAVDTVATDLTRDAARSAVRPVIADQFPGVPLEPATDCIIDNAERGELLELARAATLGATPQTGTTVSTIATRPETLRCLAETGLPALLRTL